ncbi:hypothetical protein HK102_008790 [Quaeritorhiza haematococci]|nr:hypothetical protein HK102_008790 [Quaeritorhiza haematococci]
MANVFEANIIAAMTSWILQKDKDGTSFRFDRAFHICVFFFATLAGTSITSFIVACTESSLDVLSIAHPQKFFRWFGSHSIGTLLIVPICRTVTEWIVSVKQKIAEQRGEKTATNDNKVTFTTTNESCRAFISDPARSALVAASLVFVVIVPIMVTELTALDWKLKEVAIVCPTFPFLVCLTLTLGLFGGTLGTLLLGFSLQSHYILGVSYDHSPNWGCYDLAEYSVWIQVFLGVSIVTVFSISILFVMMDDIFATVDKGLQQQKEMAATISELKAAAENAELASNQKSRFLAFIGEYQKGKVRGKQIQRKKLRRKSGSAVLNTSFTPLFFQNQTPNGQKAHEIRNPIHVITNVLDTLMADFGIFVKEINELYFLDPDHRESRTSPGHENRERTDSSRTHLTLSSDASHPFDPATGAEVNFKSPSFLMQEARDCMIALKGSTRFLLALVNDVLDLGSLELSKIKLDVRPVRLWDRLPETIFGLLMENARSKSIDFHSTISDSVPKVLMLDPLRLEQIIQNLGSNALKFTKPGGRVSIRIFAKEECQGTKSPGGTVRTNRVRTSSAPDRIQSQATMASYPFPNLVSPLDNSEEGQDYRCRLFELVVVVADTGIGIPASAIPKLFKPYSQVSASTAREFGGTGLGLSITSMLVEAMKGGITVDSEEGKGTTFTVKLPVWTRDFLEHYNDTSEYEQRQFSAKAFQERIIEELHSPEFTNEIQMAGARITSFNGMRRRTFSESSILDGGRNGGSRRSSPSSRVGSMEAGWPHQTERDSHASILVVEDEPLNRMILVQMLRTTLKNATRIHEAADGVDAVELCRKRLTSSPSSPSPSSTPSRNVLESSSSAAFQFESPPPSPPTMGTSPPSSPHESPLPTSPSSKPDRTAAKSQATPFSLIFMDISLPRMDGWTAIKTMRDMGVTSPIVVTSGNTQEEYGMHSECRVDAFMQKPFSGEIVASILAQHGLA